MAGSQVEGRQRVQLCFSRNLVVNGVTKGVFYFLSCFVLVGAFANHPKEREGLESESAVSLSES